MKNRFGNLFQITTFGESHGEAIGVVIDGCPAGLEIEEEEIFFLLKKRRPGRAYTSPRKEEDMPQIISGLFEGKTTGAPICILIKNKDGDSSKYESIKDLYRPGHSNFTYLHKYGLFDYRGGGRASARETAARVAAAGVAKKLLEKEGMEIYCHLKQLGNVRTETFSKKAFENSSIFCADGQKEKEMVALLEKNDGDSFGGVVECIIKNCPKGLGDPIYEKLEANLAKAMLSIPAVKGFEIGSGFSCVNMKGSLHNDLLEEDFSFSTNHAGGILGGISTGEDIIFRVAFKPTSSISKEQKTLDLNGKKSIFKLPEGSRHDPCVAIRGSVVVEAMAYLVLADSYLLNRSSRV